MYALLFITTKLISIFNRVMVKKKKKKKVVFLNQRLISTITLLIIIIATLKYNPLFLLLFLYLYNFLL